MPFCPKCRSEYINGIEICPDCQEPLVEELLNEDNVQYVNLVELEKVPDELSGVMMKGILENNGIKAVLRPAKIPWYDGIASTWSAYYWGILLVPQKDVERSREIIREYLEAIKDLDEEEP